MVAELTCTFDSRLSRAVRLDAAKNANGQIYAAGKVITLLFYFGNHFFFPAELVGGFTISRLLDSKPWSQVSSLPSPPNYIFIFLIPFNIFALLLQLPPCLLVVTQIPGHKAGSSPPSPPRYDACLAFLTRGSCSIFSLVGSDGCVPAICAQLHLQVGYRQNMGAIVKALLVDTSRRMKGMPLHSPNACAAMIQVNRGPTSAFTFLPAVGATHIQ